MSIRVVIADDHAVLREGLRSLLEAAEDVSVVATVGDGDAAVQVVRDQMPDVLIMDISMPGLNGLDAAREIAWRSPSTRLIMLTMHATAGHVRHALEAGAAGYLLKEQAGAEVIDAVRRVAAGERYMSPSLLKKMPSASDAALLRLSRRERQVVELVVKGLSSAAIAARVHLSPKTVDTYRSRIMTKLGVQDVPALVIFALEYGLVTPR